MEVTTLTAELSILFLQGFIHVYTTNVRLGKGAIHKCMNLICVQNSEEQCKATSKPIPIQKTRLDYSECQIL